MSQDISKDSLAAAGVTARTRISCPGCGRNDYVEWPATSDTFHWTCFNCGKSFDLHRKSAH
jgi:transposase-like protein